MTGCLGVTGCLLFCHGRTTLQLAELEAERAGERLTVTWHKLTVILTKLEASRSKRGGTPVGFGCYDLIIVTRVCLSQQNWSVQESERENGPVISVVADERLIQECWFVACNIPKWYLLYYIELYIHMYVIRDLLDLLQVYNSEKRRIL